MIVRKVATNHVILIMCFISYEKAGASQNNQSFKTHVSWCPSDPMSTRSIQKEKIYEVNMTNCNLQQDGAYS